MKHNYYIGTSGWFYNHWYGKFYPEKLSKERLLQYYVNYFNTVELNNTFYHLPKEMTVKTWREKVHRGFLFSVKASRFITHIKKLKGVKEPLKLFLKRASLLRSKLGPILFQLPPSLKRDDDLLQGFFKALPIGYNYVMEFRNKSWLVNDVFDIMRMYKVAFCIVSMPDFPVTLETTAPFSYIRMHGESALYGSKYSKRELKEWASNIKALLRKGLDVYIYFNNDAHGYAVKNALDLKKMLGK